tara:strand:- start:752 stop:895 length:144 start_codon:yes stop_codon:yes gene_type:complete
MKNECRRIKTLSAEKGIKKCSFRTKRVPILPSLNKKMNIDDGFWVGS